MDILIVSATFQEIAPLHDFLKEKLNPVEDGVFQFGNGKIALSISGPGMHRMSYTLGQLFTRMKPDLCINAGICGAFPDRGAIGEVVHVTRENIIDLGAEDSDGSLISLDGLSLHEDISSAHGLVNPGVSAAPGLRPVSGITANTAHGNARSIQRIIDTWDPDVESMEGGAFFYCCLKAEVPFIEIRSISNIVEPRNRDSWNVPLAINNLADAVTTVLRQMQ